MRRGPGTSIRVLGLLGSLFFWAAPAWAALGGSPAPAGADEKHIYARKEIVQNPGYSVNKLDTGTGTVVNEYVGPDGKVFAVTWRGPFQPNLRELLGDSYETYLAAAGKKKARGGPVSLSLPKLYVHMSGRQRAFYGRAYLPDRLPQGLSTDEIR